MPLKGKLSQTTADQKGNALEGSWGTIVPPSTPLDALRFSMEPQEIVSYAYRVVIRWKWKAGPPETITLIAGPDVVTITGHGLQRLMEALDETSLKVVRQEGSMPNAPEHRPYVISVRIEEGGR